MPLGGATFCAAGACPTHMTTARHPPKQGSKAAVPPQQHTATQPIADVSVPSLTHSLTQPVSQSGAHSLAHSLTHLNKASRSSSSSPASAASPALASCIAGPMGRQVGETRQPRQLATATRHVQCAMCPPCARHVWPRCSVSNVGGVTAGRLPLDLPKRNSRRAHFLYRRPPAPRHLQSRCADQAPAHRHL